MILSVVARDGPENEMWAARLPAFEAAHPGVSARADLQAGNYAEKVDALAAAGTIGDVLHTLPTLAQPHRLSLGQVVRPLDGLIARDKLDLKQWYPQAVEAGRLDGKVISLPFKGRMAIVALFYNQSLFDEAGLKPPDLTTGIDGVLDLAVRLTRADCAQWGLAGAFPKQHWSHAATIRRWNADVLSRDWKRATLDTPEARTAWGWYHDAFARGAMPPAAASENVFLGGTAAMLINADFNAKTRIHPAAQQRGYRYGATLMPKGPGGNSRRGGMWIPDAIQLSSASANAGEAWALAMWLTDRDTGLALALQTTGSTTPGARPDVYNDPRFLNHAVFPQALQQLDRDANQLPEVFQLPANFKIPEFEAVLGGAVDRIWRREAEPTASHMKALNDDLQRVLDLPR